MLTVSLLLTACTTTRETIKGTTLQQTELVQLTQQAQHLFNQEPRSLETAQKAYALMSKAARGSNNSNEKSYQQMIQASHYASWLSYYSTKAQDKISYAVEAIQFANTAIAMDKLQAAEFYYRAMATGLYAQQAPLQAVNAMQDIQQDALMAIKLDATYDQGGPHRILGGLYLRAPGPPIGVGSIRQALKHLKIALSMGENHPDNKLLLAEALIRTDKRDKAKELLQSMLTPQMEKSHNLEQRNQYQRAITLLE